MRFSRDSLSRHAAIGLPRSPRRQENDAIARFTILFRDDHAAQLSHFRLFQHRYEFAASKRGASFTMWVMVDVMMIFATGQRSLDMSAGNARQCRPLREKTLGMKPSGELSPP